MSSCYPVPRACPRRASAEWPPRGAAHFYVLLHTTVRARGCFTPSRHLFLFYCNIDVNTPSPARARTVGQASAVPRSRTAAPPPVHGRSPKLSESERKLTQQPRAARSGHSQRAGQHAGRWRFSRSLKVVLTSYREEAGSSASTMSSVAHKARSRSANAAQRSHMRPTRRGADAE